jgi:hypothetical protein
MTFDRRQRQHQVWCNIPRRLEGGAGVAARQISHFASIKRLWTGAKWSVILDLLMGLDLGCPLKIRYPAAKARHKPP